MSQKEPLKPTPDQPSYKKDDVTPPEQDMQASLAAEKKSDAATDDPNVAKKKKREEEAAEEQERQRKRAEKDQYVQESGQMALDSAFLIMLVPGALPFAAAAMVLKMVLTPSVQRSMANGFDGMKANALDAVMRKLMQPNMADHMTQPNGQVQPDINSQDFDSSEPTLPPRTQGTDLSTNPQGKGIDIPASQIYEASGSDGPLLDAQQNDDGSYTVAGADQSGAEPSSKTQPSSQIMVPSASRIRPSFKLAPQGVNNRMMPPPRANMSLPRPSA